MLALNIPTLTASIEWAPPFPDSSPNCVRITQPSIAAAAAAPRDMIAEEKRLLERRRVVRLDEVKPSTPAKNMAGNRPNQKAIRSTMESARVKVILSLVNFNPNGN